MAELQKPKPKVVPLVPTVQPGLYQHAKGGLYFVEGTEHCSTNGPDDGKTLVRYYSFAHQHWVSREYSQFVEEVEWYDGIKRERFMPIDIEAANERPNALPLWTSTGPQKPKLGQ